MINPTKTNLQSIDTSKENIESFFEDIQSKSYMNKARVYMNHKKSELIIDEEETVRKDFQGNSKYSTCFATKITDTVFVIEQIISRKDENENQISTSYFYPYVKNLYVHNRMSYTTFEKAAIVALMYASFLSVHSNDEVHQEHHAAVMTVINLVDNL